MLITGRHHGREYDADGCGGSLELNAFRILFLTALLSGCASASPPLNDSGKSWDAGKSGDGGRTGDGGESSHASAHPVNRINRADTQAQHCVALAMYWEARGEGDRGMLAVGSVVLNRVEDDRFPDSVCGVVYQGGEAPPCQFSWWCDGKSDRPTSDSLWASSLSLADELLTARPQDPTHGALFFHNTSMQSPWRRERTARIGHHIFYR
jgi:N-acetylmuramoyl-L-alanine amidase